MNKIIYTLALLSFFFTVSFSYADSNTHADARAQKAIDACWAISQEDRDSINTSIRDKGIIESTNCLEQHAIHLAEKYLFTQIPDHAKQFADDLKTTREAYRRIYWNIHQEIDPCTGRFFGCGTQYSSVDISAYARLVEELIKDQYRQIEDHQID